MPTFYGVGVTASGRRGCSGHEDRTPVPECRCGPTLRRTTAGPRHGGTTDGRQDRGGIAFLATNTFITGRTLMMDGGIGTFR
jgi:hypothetical protein